MSVNNYAICPCGSGKKIKFCKCNASVHQMDEVLQMASGGQVVPALDRMSSILDEDPEAAWALALRGPLLMGLREYDLLKENADRFLRLQPSNPLALTQRAITRLIGGETGPATEDLMVAIEESGELVDPMLLETAVTVAELQLNQGNFYTAMTYAAVALSHDNPRVAQAAIQILQTCQRSSSINRYLKASPRQVPRSNDVNWGERFDEAKLLLDNRKYSQAETKLNSLRRVAGDSAAVLTGLLQTAILRGDLPTQVQLFERLAESDDPQLDREQKIHYLATAIALDRTNEKYGIKTYKLSADLSSVDETSVAFIGNARAKNLSDQVDLKSLAEEDNPVPPKFLFELFDRDFQDEDLEELPSADDFARSLVHCMIYGKQTDREARLIAHQVFESDIEKVETLLKEIQPGIELEKEEDGVEPIDSILLARFSPLRIKSRVSNHERMALVADVQARFAIEALEQPLKILRGKTIADADKGETLEALVRFIEQIPMLSRFPDTFWDSLYEKSGVEKRKPITDATDANDLEPWDFGLVDPDKMAVEDLPKFAAQALELQYENLALQSAERFLAECGEGTEDGNRKVVLSIMAQTANDQVRIESLDHLIALEASEPNLSSHLLAIETAQELADVDSLRRFVEGAIQTFQADQQSMQVLEYRLMQMGLIRPPAGAPGGMPPGAGGIPGAGVPGGVDMSPASAPADSGGGVILTPDGRPANESGSGGGGKIILPGME